MGIKEMFRDKKTEDKKTMARNLVSEKKEREQKPELDFPSPKTDNKEIMVILSGNEQFILNELITRLEKLDQKVTKGFKEVGVENLD